MERGEAWGAAVLVPSSAEGRGVAGEGGGGVAAAGLTCPLGPGSPDSPCKHKEGLSRGCGVPGPARRPPQLAHLLAFLSWEASHPRVALQIETESDRGGPAWRGSRGGAAVLACDTRVPRPDAGCQTAGEGDMLALTTPPRGPVFPGKPWRKRGVQGLVSSGPGEAGSTGSPQPRLLATHPSAALPLTVPPTPRGPLGPAGRTFPTKICGAQGSHCPPPTPPAES